MATEYKSPLGLLDYIVPDRLEQQAISAFSRNPNPMNEQGQPLYGNFRPNIDPNNPQGLNNIETLLGYAYMPQVMTQNPTNKQMIDAAILRAGLEMGKGRQPGETFGGALARGAEAMSIPGKTLAAAQAAEAAARAKGMRPQVSVTTPKYSVFNSVAKNLYDNNQAFQDTVNSLTGNAPWSFSSPVIKALAGNAISYQSEYGGSIENAIMKSAEGMLNLKTTGGVKNIPDNSTNTNSNANSSNASKPNIPGIKIK